MHMRAWLTKALNKRYGPVKVLEREQMNFSGMDFVRIDR
jgi:hypothetical protein